MLTFHDEFGEFSARAENGDVVATGDAAHILYTGQLLLAKQLARASRGSLFNRKPISILQRELSPWPLM